MARQTWEQLTPVYRARLERNGITKEQHESGASLAKARGHDERQKLTDWVGRFARLYSLPDTAESIEEVIEEHGFAATYKAMRQQQRAEELWNKGRTGEAHMIWLNRNRDMPEWMFFYHGYFS